MKPWLTFALWLLSCLVACGIAYALGYNKGRLDEYKEFGTREKDQQ